ncbi:MAG: sulfurtransferase complex subunit TusB [Halioglobus sp.]
MILHTINKAPGNTAFTECLRLATPDDAILLIGDAVYAALAQTDACTQLLGTEAELYVLAADTLTAGISDRIDKHIKVQDFDGFVSLTERFPRQMAWF